MHTRTSPLLFLILMFMLALAALPAFAQDATTVVTLSPDYRITIPDDWVVEEDEELGGYFLYDDSRILYALDPTVVGSLVEVGEKDQPVHVLIDLFDALYGEPLDASAVPKLRVGSRAGVSWSYTVTGEDGEMFDAMLVVLPLNDGNMGAVEILSLEGELGDSLPSDLNDVLLTFESTEAQTVSGEAGETEPCTVSTEAANSAALRVGPGFNRTSVAYLPTNVEVEVAGSFTADDGSEWFQLDKAQAAPQSAANEIWVLRDEVTESGDCDAVGAASAPPIVPISVVPPTPAPGSSEGVPGSAEVAPPAAGLLTPLSGTWTQTLAPTTDASCLDSENVVFAVEEVYDPVTVSNSLTVNAGGGSFVWSGDLFTRVPNTNTFQGNYTFLDGDTGPMRLTLVSTTQISGTLVFNWQLDDGTWCSTTTSLTMWRG